jgi:hypothetical protein
MPKKKKSDDEISVAEATRRVISGKSSIIDCLRLEVINFSSLAKSIKPEVKIVCKKSNVNLDSIKMSLMRYTDELISEKKILEQEISGVIADSVLELKNDLIVITLKQELFLSKINKIIEFIDKFRFFQLIQGTDVFTILADQSKKKELLSVFSSPLSLIDIIENQSALILISPNEILKISGVISYLTYLLSSGQINITQIMSAYTDTIFVVDRINAIKAYNLLEGKIFFLRELKEKTSGSQR